MLPLIFDQSRSGRTAIDIPDADKAFPEISLEDCLPAKLLRQEPADLPEVDELSCVRHFTRLSQRNFSIDTHFYPLGSCTMKYNPRFNEALASWPQLFDIHPYQDEASLQGALQIAWEVERYLAEISGLPGVCLQPAAGAQGELAGLLTIKACLRSRGQGARGKVLIPESAHGTNPASCAFADLQVVPLKAGPDGDVDMADLDAKLDEQTAALMITNPSTLGLFEKNIQLICQKVHAVGGMVYMDGANLNAMLGVTRPGDFGVDVMHTNLHKTFSTPHGGGGPGAGPIMVCEELIPFLPVPRIVQREGRYSLSSDAPDSIGRVRGFLGNMGMVFRAWAYIRAYGRGLRKVAEHAVLHANYLRVRLSGHYDVAFPRICQHEVVLSLKRLKKETGVNTLDVAKRLLDYGFHAPTIYFPLVVPEALMIEPTETESLETLDSFVEALLAIHREAHEQPELVRSAPNSLRLRRLDEVKAARKPVTRRFGCPAKSEPGT